MILIVCIDDNNGMMFHNRRQSRDRTLQQYILRETDGKKLWMNGYSYKLFQDMAAKHIVVDEQFWEKAGQGEYCFVENVNVSMCESKAEQIVLFKWNRCYPSDLKFGISLAQGGWRLIEEDAFTGSSHEKITKEVYKK